MTTEIEKKLSDESAKLLNRLEELKNDNKSYADTLVKSEIEKLADEIVNIKKQHDTTAAHIAKMSGFEKQDTNSFEKESSDFNSAIRKNGGQHQSLEIKALRTDSNLDGGYLVLPTVDTAIGKIIFESSPISRLATRRTIAGNRYTKFIRDTRVQSLEEVSELPTVTERTTQTYKELSLDLGDLYGEYPISTNMLEDASYNILADLLDAIQEEVSLQLENQLINGTGINGAKGIVKYAEASTNAYEYGKIYRTPSGSATYIGSPDNLLDLWFNLKAAYRGNSTWLMQSNTHKEILKLKSTNTYHLLNLQPGGPLTPPALGLLGRPIEYAEDMPAIGTGGNVIIALADFNQAYTMIEKGGVTILRDPYSGQRKVIFKVTKRLGGGVTNFDAIKLMDVAAS